MRPTTAPFERATTVWGSRKRLGSLESETARRPGNASATQVRHRLPGPGVVRVEAVDPNRGHERRVHAPERHAPALVARERSPVRLERRVGEQEPVSNRRAAGKRHPTCLRMDPHARLRQASRGRIGDVVDGADAAVEELRLVHREPIGTTGPEERRPLVSRQRAIHPVAIGRADSLEERSA